MATFLPDFNKKCQEKMTPGEKRTAQLLLKHLDDKYIIWYEASIGQNDRKPDFIILHPDLGLIVLEVKDWSIDAIEYANPQTFKVWFGSELKEPDNPLIQARTYSLEINNLLCKDKNLVQSEGKYRGKLICPYGYGVVFPNINRREFNQKQLDTLIQDEWVICKDDFKPMSSSEFRAKLSQIGAYSSWQSLTNSQIDRIRARLFPELCLSSMTIPQEDIKVLDLEQEALARSLGNGHRVVHGVAGSGKTMILLYRARYLASLAPEKPILITCFNVALAARFLEIVKREKLEKYICVENFHKWCRNILSAYNLQLPSSSTPREYSQNLVTSLREAIANGQIPTSKYAAILIDEGHDFEPEWFSMLLHTLDESKSLLLLYDDAQNIYGQKRKKFSFKKVGIEAQGRTTVLDKNYRNTIEVLNLAYEFAMDILQTQELIDDDGQPLVKPKTAGRSGTLPNLVRLNSFEDEVNHTISTIERLNAEGIALNEIGVFCSSKL